MASACALALGCVLACSVEGASALRVLGVIPFASKSHHAVLHALLTGLADRGHSVVSLEFHAPNPLPDNYTSLPFQLKKHDPFNVPEAFSMGDLSWLQRLSFLWRVAPDVAESLLQQPQVQAVAKGERGRFDVLVVEAFFNEAFLGLAHLLQVPIVQVCPYVGSAWMFQAVGTPSPSAYVPNAILPFNDHMTFYQRLLNFWFDAYQEAGRELFYLPWQDAVMRRWLSVGGRPLPPVAELMSSTALMLVNSDVTTSYPRPLTPNLVPVGGIHLRPAKPLPPNLEEIIASATHGVIYFSMGSSLKSSELPLNHVTALLDVFRALKEIVIWKWEADSLPGKPDNVVIRKWLPQNDILAHPNVKLFITHGGLMSSYEALYHGVPLVGIPVYGDQDLNVAKSEMAGYAIKIPYKEFSLNAFQRAVNEVLSNTSYSNNVKHLSRIFRDQPEKPVDRAIWWVEYVVRHKGAPHLQSAAKDLAWYQYFLLDVLLMTLGVLLIIAVVIARLILFLSRKFSRAKSSFCKLNNAKKHN